ncbi:MAG: Fic family protein [Minisyncoccia bacterium]|jgi:Fic family protein
MAFPQNKKDLDILEERGYWKASSFLSNTVHKLIRKNLPFELGYVKQAHKITFDAANQSGIAGKYRRDNPELKRIDGSLLVITHWHNVPNEMAKLDTEVRLATRGLRKVRTKGQYRNIIEKAARLSHRLACIHPFENGNGRASRLLLNAILMRAGLHEVAIKVDKDRYLRSMRQADDGDFSMLKKIILESLVENEKKLYKLVKRKQAEQGKHKKCRS